MSKLNRYVWLGLLITSTVLLASCTFPNPIKPSITQAAVEPEETLSRSRTYVDVNYIEHTDDYCNDLCISQGRDEGELSPNDQDLSDQSVVCKCFTNGPSLFDTATWGVEIK